MKKRTYQQVTVLIILASVVGCGIAAPIVKADAPSATANFAPLLEQLIQLLTQQLQQLEQQLAAQQQPINVSQSAYPRPTSTQQSTPVNYSAANTANNVNNPSVQQVPIISSTVIFPDCLVEINTSTMVTNLSSSKGYTVSFNALIMSRDGNPLANKHVYINGAFYSSDTNGNIVVTIGYYQGGPLQVDMTEDGTGAKVQTITITPPASLCPTGNGSYNSYLGRCLAPTPVPSPGRCPYGGYCPPAHA